MSRKTVVPDDVKARTGLCACGCGRPTRIAIRTQAGRGEYAGHPQRVLVGHNMRGRAGEQANRWQGGSRVNGDGYRMLYMPDHHLANGTGYVPEHRLVWEQTHGRRLSREQHVHHIDGDRGNNDPSNLVALSSREHAAMHRHADYTRRRRAEGQHRSNADPERRKRHSERMRAWWAERKAQAQR